MDMIFDRFPHAAQLREDNGGASAGVTTTRAGIGRPLRDRGQDVGVVVSPEPAANSNSERDIPARYFDSVNAAKVGPNCPRGSRLGPDAWKMRSGLNLGSISTPIKQFCISSQF